jgi:hypothetical protein
MALAWPALLFLINGIALTLAANLQSGSNGNICDKLFVVHDASYYLEDGAYLTSDSRQRLSNQGVPSNIDGSDRPLEMPAVPEDTPTEWLTPLPSGIHCQWVFRVPNDSVTTLEIEFLDLAWGDTLLVQQTNEEGAPKRLSSFSGPHFDGAMYTPLTIRGNFTLVLSVTTPGYMGFVLHYAVNMQLCNGVQAINAPISSDGLLSQSYAGFLTNDMHWRQIHADSQDGFGLLSSVPDGDPETWLRPYWPNTQCMWEFNNAPETLTTLTIK